MNLATEYNNLVREMFIHFADELIVDEDEYDIVEAVRSHDACEFVEGICHALVAVARNNIRGK